MAIARGLIVAGTALAATAAGYLATAPAGPAAPRTERDWQRALAPAYGVAPDQIEVRIWDGSRVDWLTDRYAVEIDWDRKWAEGVGQAAWYAAATGRQPVLLLLTRTDSDRFAYRAAAACARAGVTLWVHRLPAAAGQPATSALPSRPNAHGAPAAASIR